jgi:hypothetical protein
MDNPRIAHYSSAANDEIHLRYVQEGGQNHGKNAEAFYSPVEYAQRQARHGEATYSTPHPAQ